MAALQMHGDRVMTALGAGRWMVPTQLLFFGLLGLIVLLNFLELWGQCHGLNAHGRGVGPCAAPSADRAAERLVHGALLRRGLVRGKWDEGGGGP